MAQGFRLWGQGRGLLGWAALSEQEWARALRESMPVPGSRETVLPVMGLQRHPLGVWPVFLALPERRESARAPQGPGLRVWALLELGFLARAPLAQGWPEQDQQELALPVSGRRAWDPSAAQAQPE